MYPDALKQSVKKNFYNQRTVKQIYAQFVITAHDIVFSKNNQANQTKQDTYTVLTVLPPIYRKDIRKYLARIPFKRVLDVHALCQPPWQYPKYIL